MQTDDCKIINDLYKNKHPSMYIDGKELNATKL